jgi:hypothetical protein
MTGAFFPAPARLADRRAAALAEVGELRPELGLPGSDLLQQAGPFGRQGAELGAHCVFLLANL